MDVLFHVVMNTTGWSKFATSEFSMPHPGDTAACVFFCFVASPALLCCRRGHGSGDVMGTARVSGEWPSCSQFKCCRAPGMDAHAQSVFQCRAGQAVLLLAN